ncbi:hypothetical protein [Martelella mangrovi]|uniref:Uncharacterized protein n=1 Tax=Martelella mangrovi TaxID=1397477 RepID=A0ABV2IG25_9HYPH
MNNFFNTPEDDNKDTVVTKYVPREWIDEYTPLPQADPNAFLKSKDGNWFLVPHEDDFEDAGSFCIAVTHGDLIDFDSNRHYGSRTIKVAEDGSYTLSEDFPADATHFVYDDADDFCNTLQEVIADGRKNDPEAFTPPLETTVSAWFWGDTTTFRVVIEEGAARLDRLPEPPLVLPYTNWRGETAIRRIRPMCVKFTSTSWHREPQWILEAYDYDRQEMRGFALKDFGQPTPTIFNLVWERHGVHCHRAKAPVFGSINVSRTHAGASWQIFWSIPGFTDLLMEESFPTATEAMKATDNHIAAVLFPEARNG